MDTIGGWDFSWSQYQPRHVEGWLVAMTTFASVWDKEIIAIFMELVQGSVVIVIQNNDKWRPIVIVHGVIRWKRTIQFFVVVESQTSPALCWFMTVYAKIQLGVKISIRKENMKHIIDLKRWWCWAKINSPSTLSARSAVTIALGIPDQKTSHQTITAFFFILWTDLISRSTCCSLDQKPHHGVPWSGKSHKSCSRIMLGQLGSKVINLNHLFFKGDTTALTIWSKGDTTSTWDN